MAKIRVPLYKTPGKSAVIDTETGAVTKTPSTKSATTTPTVTQPNTSVHAVLSNPIATIATNPDGTGGDFASAVGTCYVFNGTEDVTGLNDAVNGPVYSLSSATAGLTASIDPITGAYSASLDDTHDTGEADFKVVYGSAVMHPAFTVVKNKNGKSVIIRADAAGFTYQNGSPSPSSQTVTLTVKTTNMTGHVTWSSSPNVTLGITGDTATLSAADFDAAGADQVTISATLGGITDYLVLVRLTPTATTTTEPTNSTPGNVTNPGFEAGDTGWTKNGWSIVNDAANAGHGSWYATITGSANVIVNTNRVPVDAGWTIRPHCRFKTASGASGNGYVGVRFYKADGTAITPDYFTDATHLNKWVTGPSTAYDAAHIHVVAPTGAAFASLAAYVYNCSGKWYLDDCGMINLPFHLGEVGDDPTPGGRGGIHTGYIDGNNRPWKTYRKTTGVDVDVEDLSKHMEVTYHIGGKGIPHLDLGNGSQIINRNLGNIAETADLLHWKASQQTALLTNPRTDNVLNDPNFTSADFWNGGIPNGDGSISFSVAAGAQEYATNLDGRGAVAIYKIKPNTQATVEFTVDTNVTTGGAGLQAYLRVYDSSGAGVSFVGTGGDHSAAGAYKGTATVPSNAAYFEIIVHANNAAGTTTLTGSVSGVHVRVGHQTITDAGGARIGDGHNLITLNSGGYATSYWSGITFSPGINNMGISAGVSHIGGVTTSYNSSSISGLSAATTYSFYYKDANYAGGTQTLYAAQGGTGNATAVHTLIGDDANRYIGDGTTKSASGGGGGGGPPSCVALDMFLRPNVPAVMAREGQKIDGVEKFSPIGERRLLNAWTTCGPAVRITTANGAVLDCGEETPFDLKDGTSKLAKDMQGETVLTDAGEDTVASVEPLGAIPLMYVSAGGISFMAGKDVTKRIASHNTVKP